jgi:hypothetical protein
VRNSSQDENYVGPVGHEKAIHKWQFDVPNAPKRKKKWKPEDDPEWERIAPGKWRRKLKETRMTGRESAED